MLKVAVLLDNTLKTDRRALLEINSLQSLPINLTLYCLADKENPELTVQGNLTIKRIFNSSYWAFANRNKLVEIAHTIAKEKYDVLHCHDQYMLQVGATIKKLNPSTILIYESRELFHSWPINYAKQSLLNRLKSYIVRFYEMKREKRNGEKINYLIAVNQSISDILARYFKLKTKAITLRNIPSYKEISTTKDPSLRRKYNIPDSDVVAVYIGINIYRHTNLMENFVDAIGNMPNTHLIIITRKNERRIWFEEYVNQQAYKNIHFHDIIPINEIEKTISCCDMGVVSAWYRKKLSYWLALDNKLFTYIMSEIPLLGTAQPEYEKIINTYKVGLCINPEKQINIQNAIHEIIANKKTYVENCQKAKKILCWEEEQKQLLNLYHSLITNKEKTV